MTAAILLVWLAPMQSRVPLGGISPASLAASGEKLLEAQRTREAREAFQGALQLEPANFAALSGMGFIDFSEGRFAPARIWLEKAVQSRHKSFQARFLLGATLVELNDSTGAIGQLSVAHRLNPEHADARKLLAAQYSNTRQYKQAIALLAPVVDRVPYDEETHLLLIGARQASGDSAGVFALATRAARRFPRSPQVAAWLGFQLQFSGRYQEAEKELRKAIEIDPLFGVSYQLLGEVCLKREDYADAVSWFRKAAGRMPQDMETLMGLGRALAAMGDTAAGLEALRSAARVAPENAQVHLQLSRLYFRIGDEEKARQEADLSVKLRSSAPDGMEAPAALRAVK
ncbi:MAG: tetratricopeptide repeat protein [Bryobacterales bacterium]|nr:tetratricopeptide repeat protein [Bryobacterales bacterium]